MCLFFFFFLACVCGGRYPLYLPLSRRAYHKAALLNDLLCVQPRHADTHFSRSTLNLIRESERAEQRIHNGAAELLDLQARAVIPRRRKEAISEPFKGWDGDILHNTLGCPVQRGRYLIKSSQILRVFFFSSSASVFLPSSHLSLIPVAAVIRYVNDLSLSQMRQINQGQWVLFRSGTGEGGGGGSGGGAVMTGV